MKINKKTFGVVYIRFLNFNKYIKINLASNIFNEQFSSLSFFLHFISTQQYSIYNNLIYPNDGWITLDKQIDNSDQEIACYNFKYSSLIDFLKYIKKKVSYDLRCLKKVEQDYKVNISIIKFIEDIANSNEDLYKRVQLRQLKRVFNQRSIACKFKIENQPSIFKNLHDIWTFITSKIDIYADKYHHEPNLIYEPITQDEQDLIDFNLNFDFIS